MSLLSELSVDITESRWSHAGYEPLDAEPDGVDTLVVRVSGFVVQSC